MSNVVNLIEDTIEIPYGKIAYKCWNPAGEKTIVCLHGWLDNANTFDLLIPLLLQRFKEHRIVALDLPGHGLSDHYPRGFRYHYVDYAEHVLLAVKALNINQFSLIGHSLGAAVSSLVAATSGQVDRLMLIDGIGPMYIGSDQVVGQIQKAFKQMLEFNQKGKTNYASFEHLVKARANAMTKMSYEASEILCKRGAVSVGDTEYTWATDKALKLETSFRFTEDMVSNLLTSLSMPVMFLGAKDSYFYQADWAQKRFELIDQLTVQFLPGHHHFHLEKDTVEAIANALIDWYFNVK